MVGCGAKPDPMVLGQRAAKAIPLQSSPSEVSIYLTGQKIEHSEYKRDAIEGRFVLAEIYDSRWKWAHTDFLVIFRFDEHDHLIAADVREDHKGP